MKAKRQGRRVLRSEPRFHLARPQTARGAILGDLFEEVVVGVEKERKSGSKLVYLQSRLDGRTHIGQPVVQSKGQLLNRSGAGFPDMVAADANGVIAGRGFDAEANGVVDDFERGSRRADPFLLRDVFFQDVVLQRSLKISKADALAFSDHKIHGEENDGGTVDGHRHAHPIKRNVAKQGFHIRHRVDGHAASSNLASGSGIVGVVTHESRHIEGNGKPCIPLFE